MKRSSTVMLVLGLAAYCPAMHADSYTFTAINVPGINDTIPDGINDAGQIVGTEFNGASHGFLYSNGAFTTLNAPGSTDTIVGEENSSGGAINNAGQIVGYYMTTPSGPRHVFLYSQGSFTTIGPPPGLLVFSPNSINDAGTILGDCCIYSNGAFQGISSPPGDPYDYSAASINNAGQIVEEGFYTVLNINGYPVYYTNSFLNTDGIVTPIQVPGATSTFATAINNKGQIAGTFEIFGVCAFCGFFVDTGGVFTIFNFPGYNEFTSNIAAEVGGINDEGQIVGTTYSNDGSFVGFLATPTLTTPTPEPDSLLLYTCGLVVAGMKIRRKVRS